MRSQGFALLAAILLVGCDQAPLAPPAPGPADLAASRAEAAADNEALATLRRATARYHDLDAAIADGFILLHECEVRPGAGAVGILYVHLGRYLDGTIDPAAPDGLLYAPMPDRKPRLAGVELALPMDMWPDAEPPRFLGIPFQAEDEFGAFGLHIWLWMHNPEGLFAEAHPDIACEAES